MKRKEARSMEKINGIILSGKVYEYFETFHRLNECDACDLRKECDVLFEDIERTYCSQFHNLNHYCFRYSPSLTERLNNLKTKEK